MKIIYLIISILIVNLNAKNHKVIVEPIDSFVISSEVKGKIIKLDKIQELKYTKSNILSIDASLDKKRLKNLKLKLKFLDEQIKIKEENYHNITSLKGKSKLEKDNKLIEILGLKSQKTDLLSSIAILKDTIANKTIKLNDFYLKEFLVSNNQFVNIGTKLFVCEDHSSSKVILYVSYDEREVLIKQKEKAIVINGDKNHKFKIIKISNSADTQYLSSYVVELENKTSSTTFGHLIDVNIKE